MEIEQGLLVGNVDIDINMRIIRMFIILSLIVFSIKAFGQEYKLKNEYFKKTRVLGIYVNLYPKFKRSYKTLSLSDSTYMLDKTINSFFSKVIVLDGGNYTVNNKKIILRSDKKNKKKVIKIRKRYLTRNIILLIIREEYCPGSFLEKTTKN